MAGLTKNDSGRIGFVVSCLYFNALSVEEMKQWVLRVYEEGGNPPVYFVDLLEFQQGLFHLHNTIGFIPVWPYSEDAESALYGIAYERDHPPFDCPLSHAEALEKLQQYPEIAERFRLEFPFLDLNVD